MTAPPRGFVPAQPPVFSAGPPPARWEDRRTYASQLGPDADLPVWTAFPTASGIVPLRPLGLGDILGGAFRGVRFNPGATMGLTMVLMLGVQLLAVLVTAVGLVLSGSAPIVWDTAQLTNYFETAAGAASVAVAIGLFMGGNVLGTYVITAMLSYVVCEGVAAHRVTPRDALRRLWRRLGATLAYGLLASLAVVVPFAVIGGTLAALTADVGSDVGMGASLVLLVVLVLAVVAFPVMVKLTFTVPAIAVEGLGPFAAIRRSWRLTHDRFWRTFGIGLLTGVIVQMVSGVMSQVLGVVGLVVAMSNPIAGTVGMLATSLLASTLTLPLQAGVTALLYTDARIRDEGLDIALAEAMAR